ncbi:unnamed protein product [Knipowitschia caucasica]
MSGRGRGRSKKAVINETPGGSNEQSGSDEEGEAVGEEETQTSSTTLSDIAKILRAHIGQQKAKDAYWDEEVTRQEQRFNALQQQFSMFKMETQAKTPTKSTPTSGLESGPSCSESGDYDPAPCLISLIHLKWRSSKPREA